MNQTVGFENKDISKHCRTKPAATKREIALLQSISMIKKGSFYKNVKIRNLVKKKKVTGWFTNTDFPYLSALFDLLITSKSVDKKDLASRIKKTGKVKMLVVAGAFLKDDESRLDILAVGDGISQKKFENVVRNLESEIGTELRYSAFTIEEFKYRVSMYDKLVCDVFDYNHEVVFTSPGLSTEGLKGRK
jgi:hypothetical protein